jgi:uncharacterized protein (TIGR04141 family)
MAVPDMAVDALVLFRSKAYRDTTFKIIDFLSPVLDSTIEARLDEALVAAIRGGTDEFEISIPEIIPEGMASFRFQHAGFTHFHADLSLELYRTGLDARLVNLTLDDLKKHTVAAYGENEDRPSQHWSVHRALVGSLVLDGERYALNEGYWYRVDESFKATADTNCEGREVEAWSLYWANLHNFFAERLQEDAALQNATLLVRFEELCARPEAMLDRILAHAGFAADDMWIALIAQRFRAPSYYTLPFDETERQTIHQITASAAACRLLNDPEPPRRT